MQYLSENFSNLNDDHIIIQFSLYVLYEIYYEYHYNVCIKD